MSTEDLRQLDQDQLDYFTEDGHKVYQAQWQEQTGRIPSEIGGVDEEFSILDIGGANGRFSDRLLAEYPRAKAVVVDSSEYLLKQNIPNERKKTLLGSATKLPEILGDEKFDFVFVNCLLHHLVTPTYSGSRRTIRGVLRDISNSLSDRGRVSIWENIFEGALLTNLPGRAIFELTSIRAISKLARKLGANTAGVGVCFLSRCQWQADLELADLRVRESHWMPMGLPLYQRIPLTIGSVGAVHMWCGKN
jgi:SAM-dependent methyltransferase